MSEPDQPRDPERVLRIFEEGRRFTEDLLKENEKLRLLVARLRAENIDIESRFIKVDVPRMQEKLRITEEEVHELRDSNQELRRQFESVEDENREFADRYVQVERQYSDLVHMYVASHRLHATLDYYEVVAAIKEIVINMIGSEVFGIYLIDETRGDLVLVGQEGLPEPAAPITLGQGLIGSVAAAGTVYVAPEGAPAGPGDVLAAIPLKLKETVVGVIAIHRFLCQKDGIRALDLELFELLGAHAASALYAASQYYVSERKRATLEGFMQLLRASPAQP
jgi:hypothetical protein